MWYSHPEVFVGTGWFNREIFRLENGVKNLRLVIMACMMCIAFSADANELVVAGKSATDAFGDKMTVQLLRAAIKHDASEARRLVQAGANANAIGEGGITPLLWVELNRDVGAMKILIDVGADPNKFVLPEVGETGFGPPVWLAAGAGQQEILEFLLDHGGDANLAISSKSPLMMALSGEHLDCAELLIRHGANVNYSEGPMSALGAALVHVRFDLALWVLNHGYTHNLVMARRMLSLINPRPGQEPLKAQAIAIVDGRLAEQRDKEQK